MDLSNISPGIYLNMFEVEFLDDTSILLMVAERKDFVTLKELRAIFSDLGLDLYLYAHGKNVYGYGEDMDVLEGYGFKKTNIDILRVPKLVSRMILEGISSLLISEGFSPEGKRLGRMRLFDFSNPIEISPGRLFLYKGYDLRSIYLRDLSWNNTDSNGPIRFFLIVDTVSTVRDKDGNGVHPHDIVSKFGRDALIRLREVQGDLIRRNGEIKINLEVSKLKFRDILKFVKTHDKFTLPCGISVNLSSQPLPVVMTISMGDV